MYQPTHRLPRAKIWALAGATVGAITLLTSCATTANGEPTAADSPIASSTTRADNSNPGPADDPDQQGAATVSVDWGDGRNTAGMSSGVPNPAGWYESAFGTRTAEKILYLTYDDGPWPPYTDEVLALLAKYQAKATFFVTGGQAKAHPQLLEQTVSEGHALGDQTMTHADLVGLSRKQVKAELAGVQQIVGSRLGGCMRPPYGLINTKVADVSRSLGLTPILWTAHAQDWNPPSVAQMVTMLKKGTSPGAVILLHDSAGKEKTIEATRQMLPWWQAQGYRLETVPACRVG